MPEAQDSSSEEIHTCTMVRGMANPSIVIYKMGCECHEQAVGSGSLAENIQQRFVIGRHDDADAVVATVENKSKLLTQKGNKDNARMLQTKDEIACSGVCTLLTTTLDLLERHLIPERSHGSYPRP